MNSETLRTHPEETKKVAEQMPVIDDLGHLKMKINNLLWEELPAKTPLGEMELLACDFVEQIMAKQEMYGRYDT